MAPVRLTETAIRAAAKKAADNNQRVQVVDAATQGLRIRIAPSKRGTWSLALRDNDGRMRRYSLGQWPEMVHFGSARSGTTDAGAGQGRR